MIKKIKSLLLKGLEKSGYKLVKLGDCPEEVWLHYTAYDAPDKEETLEKYLEWIKDFQTIYLLGYTALTKILVSRANQLYPGKKICIVWKEIERIRTGLRDYAEPLFLSLPKALEMKPDCWVLCDLGDAYQDYKLLRDYGFENIFHRSIFHKSPWKMSDFYPELHASLDKMPKTMLDDARLLTLAECVRYSAKLEGDLLEIGTYRGGSGFLICKVLEKMKAQKSVNLIDWYEQQSSDVRFSDVKEVFKGFPFAQVLSGRAEEIISRQEELPLSFIHVDVNADKTIVEEVLPILYRRLVKSGIILFDNYYFRFFCKYNFDKFASSVGEKILLLPSIPEGLLIKSKD